MSKYFNCILYKDLNPNRKKHEFSDVSKVEKFEISQQEYEKRTDSVLHYKMVNKIGRFAEPLPEDEVNRIENEFQEEAVKIKLEDRCQVDMGDSFFKKGTVMFVGKTEFKPGIEMVLLYIGYWVGIKYDEPLGKHDGTVQGKRYFTCPQKYGGFVRPNKVQVGDYPEDDLLDLDEF
jgi:tubulin-folding cofactor B